MFLPPGQGLPIGHWHAPLHLYLLRGHFTLYPAKGGCPGETRECILREHSSVICQNTPVQSPASPPVTAGGPLNIGKILFPALFNTVNALVLRACR
ncbi:hypothetical protein HMPREF1508_1043 [Shuttleworthella sp. MSX8B]|nr:hypothetical protein HMPREF1508_1043 [Shuttleworthia sp. MSX8B]